MSDAEMIMGDAGKAMLVPRGQYSDTETYGYLDFVYSGEASYVAKKLTTGNPPAEDNEYWQLLARGGTLTENSDVSNTTVTFEKAGSRINIFSKDSLSVIAGKISKWFADLKTVAFSGKYSDLEGRLTVTNNDLANVPGTAWDAVRGAAIRQDVDKLNSDLTNYIYPHTNGGDADNIKTNYHKFVFNMDNLPESYGFLDVSFFNGNSFTPSSSGVIRQRFTGWNTGREYTRCFYSGVWTPWKSDNYKKVAISSDLAVSKSEQIISMPDTLKSANEILVAFEVAGAADLARTVRIVPGVIMTDAVYFYRSENQKASVYARYLNGNLYIGTYLLNNLTIKINNILYR